MTTIAMVDFAATGHHISYARILGQELSRRGHSVVAIGHPTWLSGLHNCIRDGIALLVSEDAATLKSQWAKKWACLRALELAGRIRADIVHFLYLDRYILPLRASYQCGHACTVRATLHWAYFLPEFSFGWRRRLISRVEMVALRTLLCRGLRVMVHSTAVQRRMQDIFGMAAFDFVPYPAECRALEPEVVKRLRVALRNRLGLGEDDILMLAFGGTRRDKGVDIAIRGLALLPERYHLLVAGRAEDYSTEELVSLAELYGVRNRVHLDMRFIPDDEVPAYFIGVDLVVLPYRRVFAGQSGPLTMAAAFGVPIVAAEVMVLKETIQEYGLGETFAPEDPRAMAEAVLRLQLTRSPRVSSRFCREHSPASFGEAVLRSYGIAGADTA